MARLTAKEMPPKPVPAPPEEASQQVIAWIQAVRAEQIKKSAGDPGLVLARRLKQRRIQLHDSRSDRAGYAGHARVSG